MSIPAWVVATPKTNAAGNRPLPMLDTLLPLAVPVQVRPPSTVTALVALWQLDQM
jgi:hypothetical protein